MATTVESLPVKYSKASTEPASTQPLSVVFATSR